MSVNPQQAAQAVADMLNGQMGNMPEAAKAVANNAAPQLMQMLGAAVKGEPTYHKHTVQTPDAIVLWMNQNKQFHVVHIIQDFGVQAYHVIYAEYK